MLGLWQKKTRLKTQYYYYYYHYSLIRLISSEAKNTLNSPQTILHHWQVIQLAIVVAWQLWRLYIQKNKTGGTKWEVSGEVPALLKR